MAHIDMYILLKFSLNNVNIKYILILNNDNDIVIQREYVLTVKIFGLHRKHIKRLLINAI